MIDGRKKIRFTLKAAAATAAQQAFWESEARYRAYVGGVGAGKTYCGAIEILKMPAGSVGIVVSPTYTMLMQTTLVAFKEIAEPFIFSHVNSPVIKTVLHNGTIIYWCSGDRPNRLRGINAGWFWIDEACYVDVAVMKMCMARLRHPKGPNKGWITTTPRGFDWVFELFEKSSNANFKLFHATTKENTLLPANFVEDNLGVISSAEAEQELEGKFVDLNNSRIQRRWFKYFPGDKNPVLDEDGVPLNKHGKRLPVQIGVDLAISLESRADYTAYVVSAYDADSGARYVLEVVRDKKTFHGTQEMIKEAATRWNPQTVFIEGVQYQSACIQELRRTTSLPIERVIPKGDKVQRFLPVEGQIEHGNVFFAKNLPDYFQDELISFPGGKNDDCCDALQMSLNIATRRMARLIA